MEAMDYEVPAISCYTDGKKKVKSAYEPSGPSGRRLSPVSVLSMRRLGILLLPPGWDASPSQGYPPAL